MSKPADYASVFETLNLSTSDTMDPNVTITSSPLDWRDTLRSSLPRLVLGEATDAQFKISSVLGRGGMGIVHLAYQAALGRFVALKTVPQDRASRDSENALLQEARVMGLVEHPNVVPVHVIGQDDNGRPLIVMKRIDGTAWSTFLDGKAEVPSDDVLGFHLGVVLALCRAISFAHSRDLLHRDIKPENVMIGKFGEVYVLDWGLAASMSTDVPFVPFIGASDAVVGTPAYMAPEMTVGLGCDVGVHTDIFLIGAVLYHVVTGNPPNRGQSLFDVLACAYEGRARPYPEDVPSELREICERAMAHEPGARYETVDELRVAVEAFTAHRNSYDLAATAHERLVALRAIAVDGDSDEVHRLFGETRFGFLSALQIWDANVDAQEGLQACLRAMIDHEISQNNVAAARALMAQLSAPDPELAARIDELERQLGQEAAKLEKLAYDYDENVGIGVKRWVVAVMAGLFVLPPVLERVAPIETVPTWLHWITTDGTRLAVGAWGFAFLPFMIAILYVTFTRLGDHKSSRIFAEGLFIMYVVGFGARSSIFWADAPIHLALGGEAAVFSVALMMLGIAVDRRLFPPGVVFMLAALAVAMTPAYPVPIFCGAASLACMMYVAGDILRRFVPGLSRRPFARED